MSTPLGKCSKCTKVVKAGVFCGQCKQWLHRKCEKISAGEGLANYKCKACTRMVGVSEDRKSYDEMFSDCSGDEMEGSCISGVSDCERCSMLEEEVNKERLKCKTLEEENRALLTECIEFQAELQRMKKKLKELEWNVVGMRSEKEKEKKQRRWSGGMIKEGGSVLETENRFNALQDVDEFPPLPMVSRGSSKNVKQTGKKDRKKKVLILSSSQGRFCSNILQKKLGENYEVCGIVKPNARLTDVVDSAETLVRDFNENDCLIVMGGTNDIETNYSETIPEGIRKVLPLSKQTNIIFNSIPARFDRFDLKHHVDKANRIIHEEINKSNEKKSSNIRLNFVNERLSRDCYTRHGLHLNFKGKSQLCDKLSAFVLDCLNKTNFLVQRVVRRAVVK